MKTLSKEDILAAKDRASSSVEVPEWGGSVLVQVMSGTERDRYELSMLQRQAGKTEANLVDMRARLCAMTIVDESGKLLFKENDIAALGNKSGLALERVFVAAQRVNGLNQFAAEQAEKNSVSAPSGASTSV